MGAAREARTIARECAAGEATSRAANADVARGRAVQAVLEPPASQAVGQSVVAHRSAAGTGLSSTFVVTHARGDGTVLFAVGAAGSGTFSGPLMAAALSATAARLSAECATAGDMLNALDATLRCPGAGLPASVTAAVFSPADGRLEVASAGHCPPILLRGSTAERIEIDEQPPLFSEPGRKYSSGVPFVLQPDDRVLLYTEGAVDADVAGDTCLGVEGLAGLAAERYQADRERFLDDLNALLTAAAAQAEGWCLLSLDYGPAESHLTAAHPMLPDRASSLH